MRSPDHSPAKCTQKGVVTMEFAFIVMFGILPLILFTFNGVFVFAARQSLSLAAAEGSRAALRHGTSAQKRTMACQAASNGMAWLVRFSRTTVDCANPTAAPIIVSAPHPCIGNASAWCMDVTTVHDVDAHPFLPGIGPMFGWVFGHDLRSTAVVHLDPSFLPGSP